MADDRMKQRASRACEKDSSYNAMATPVLATVGKFANTGVPDVTMHKCRM